MSNLAYFTSAINNMRNSGEWNARFKSDIFNRAHVALKTVHPNQQGFCNTWVARVVMNINVKMKISHLKSGHLFFK
mgnify:CR=1 FL=1